MISFSISLHQYCFYLASPIVPLTIPVFPSRNFRHSYLFINTRAGINRPEDLRHKKVGVVEYQMTAALWIRGVLQHDHGVHPREMEWFTGGMSKPGYVERAPITLPEEINLQEIPEDRHLEEMLEVIDSNLLFSKYPRPSLGATRK